MNHRGFSSFLHQRVPTSFQKIRCIKRYNYPFIKIHSLYNTADLCKAGYTLMINHQSSENKKNRLSLPHQHQVISIMYMMTRLGPQKAIQHIVVN